MQNVCGLAAACAGWGQRKPQASFNEFLKDYGRPLVLATKIILVKEKFLLREPKFFVSRTQSLSRARCAFKTSE
jgi:hypothetical protein